MVFIIHHITDLELYISHFGFFEARNNLYNHNPAAKRGRKKIHIIYSMLRTISISRTPLRPHFQNRVPHCSIPNQTPSPPSTSSSLFSYSLYSTSSKQEKEDRNEVVSLLNRDPNAPPRLFVVQPRLRPDSILQAKLNEALNLANSLEEQRDGSFGNNLCDKETPPHVVVQNPLARHQTRADTYFGKGTLEAGEVDAIFVNTTLSGIQQRNLERLLGKPVLDRVGLIIEIFNAHACTKEGKLQAELAALMYKKSILIRMRGPGGRLGFGMSGEAEIVSARGRGSAGAGFISGAGESELQLQRRRIMERRSSLLEQIKDVRRTRAVQRASRKRHGGSGQGLATVAVVGYTNAGKSTLVSALSHSDLYSDSRLFATVDPRLRSVRLPSGKKVLVSDTVGFISDLPVQLVEAFHATLEEVVEADLLVHVLDCTAPNLEEHRSTVLHVLEQIGVSKEKLENMIEVWNKIDSEGEDGGMDVKESLEDGEDGDVSSLSGEDDDVESELSPGAANYKAYDPFSEMSAENLEALDDQELDYQSEDNQDPGVEGVLCMGSNSADEQQSEYPKDWAVDKELQSQVPSGPHVRTSAITGVGLQELLELIDKKLKVPNVVQKGVFDQNGGPLAQRRDPEALPLPQIVNALLTSCSSQCRTFFGFISCEEEAAVMSRRQVGSTRRNGNFPFSGAFNSKSKSSPLLSIGLVVVGAILLIGYVYKGSGAFGGSKIVSRLEGDFSCTLEVQRAIPYLKKAYSGSMHKVLHIGPDTCSVVSALLKEQETEAWGVEPYEIEDTDSHCKSLIRKGIVRVADIKFPLPYKAKSFSLVIVSDALDYLSPKYLNKTLPEIARVSIDGLVIFSGFPGQQKAKLSELSKFGRPAKMRSTSWWVRYFVQTSLEENEAASKKFEQAATQGSYSPSCQVFHLNSYH
ncbi:hypothetical protein ACLB2K_003842 [Fragaria x ananassa]